jgi:AcrR family transcriptional regulator
MTTKPEKKEQILSAAEKLFALRGFDATSVRDICQEADVNVAMVNYYFGSKDGMFREMVAQKALYARVALEELVANKQLSPMQKMDLVIEHQVTRMFRQKSYTMVIIREMSKDRGDGQRNILQEIFIPNMKLIKTIIIEGNESGEFRKVDTELTIATIIGAIWNIISTGDTMLACMGSEIAPEDPEELKKRVIRHLQQLIRHHLLIEANGTES